MSATRLTCPACQATLRLAQAVPAGKQVKCPKCANLFLPAAEAAETAVASTPRPSARAAAGGEADDVRPKRRRPKAKSSKGGINPLLIVVPVVIVLILLVVGGAVG